MDKGFKEPAGGLMIVSEFAIRICPQSPQLATDESSTLCAYFRVLSSTGVGFARTQTTHNNGAFSATR